MPRGRRRNCIWLTPPVTRRPNRALRQHWLQRPSSSGSKAVSSDLKNISGPMPRYRLAEILCAKERCMTAAFKKYRLVTRSDFDGLVCAVLLKHLDMIDEIKFVHPK